MANVFDNVSMKEEHYKGSDFDAIIREIDENNKNHLDPLVWEAMIHAKEDFREMYDKVRSEGL